MKALFLTPLLFLIISCGSHRNSYKKSPKPPTTTKSKKRTHSNINPKNNSSLTTICHKILVNNELQLIVETFNTYNKSPSNTIKINNTKLYLIKINLTSTDQSRLEASVYGPLWQSDKSKALLNFEHGIVFTKEELKAMKSKPMFKFDTDGTLFKYRFDFKTKKPFREALLTTKSNASWKQKTKVTKYTNNSHPGSEEMVQTRSGKYALIHEKGVSILINKLNGKQIIDKWLTKSFTKKCSIKEFRNVRIFLSEDLNHIVASPRRIWNRGVHKSVITKFELDGKIYDRKKYGIYYSRPNNKAMIYERKDDDPHLLYETPHQIITINKELVFFMSDEEEIKLYKPNSAAFKSIKYKSKNRYSAFPDLKHYESSNEILLFEIDSNTSTGSENLYISKWNYEGHTLIKYNLDVEAFFIDNKIIEITKISLKK